MSLKISGDRVPEGAVELTETEAIYYQWTQLKNWPIRKDVWPYLYGLPALTLLGAYSGLKINRHYRMKLKLHQYGIKSTSLAMSVTPAIFVVLPHLLFVTEPLFINRNPCTVCSQINAIGAQLFGAVVYPVVLSPIANFMFATRHGTYALPYWAEYKNTVKLWMSMNKTLAPKMKINIPLQIIAASFVTYKEAESLYTVRSKIERGEVNYRPPLPMPR